jgi:LAO/AO transport system kinase
VENDPSATREIIAALYPHTGGGHVLGITGAPGSGKSTLVAALAAEYRRRGLSVGIVAVDPSSPYSGGAIMGDRIRMRELAGDEGVFIRSMASRGSLGGLARATADTVRVLDACGYRRILVETVGTGQAEIDIARTAHTTLVVHMPGAGDEIQTLKAGIIEIADIHVVNKADLAGADRATAALRALRDLADEPMDSSEALWCPPVLRAVATTGEGVPETVDAIEDHVAYWGLNDRARERERARAAAELEGVLRNELLRLAMEGISPERWRTTIEDVVARRIAPYHAAHELLRTFLNAQD